MSSNDKPTDVNVKVLLVDDQPANLLALEAVLDDLKWNLVRAHSGEEALRKLHDDDFAVVLLDVLMPGLNGYETAKLIRGWKRSRHTPIIFLTASDCTDLPLVEAYRLGAVDYLVKPVVPDILRAKVTVFIELYQKTEEVRRQAEQLRQLERKEFERQLEEERLRLFRVVADSAPVLLWMAGPDGLCTFVNKPALQFTGHSTEQERGKCWIEDIHPDDRPDCLETYHSAFDARRPFRMEYRLRRHDGQYRWVLDTGVPHYESEDGFAGYVGSAIDITAHREAEDALEQQGRAIQAATQRTLEVLESVVEHTLDGVVLIDEKGVIRSFNRQAERTFGYAPSEVVGKNVNILMPEPYFSQHDGYLANYLRTGVAKIIGTGREVEGRRKDGSTFPLELVVNEFQIDKRRHFIGSVRDISARKKLELQLLQSQKMEAVGQLAGGVAHDFNNLLTVINGYSEILMTSLGPKDPKRDLLAQIHKAGERAGSLTRQLLAFSRKQILEPKVLDLNAEVTDAARMLRRLIGEDILLTTNLNPKLGPVKVDPGQMQQVLINLAVNARDAMPRGGMLTIETRNVRLDEAYCSTHPYVQPGNYSMLAVSDTGIGMDGATKARIFEPFYTTKVPGKGTGLGLAMVYGILKQSGGSIEVYSEPDRGATFKIYLPQVREQVSSGKSLHGLGVMPKGSETLLLVEDEDAVRALSGHVLRSCGYTVLEATNGKAAVQLLEGYKGPVDLVISDVVMPHLGGRQLAEQLAQLRPSLRILFLSGYTDDAVVRHGVLDESFAFLQKPFTTIGLAQKVREVLDENLDRTIIRASEKGSGVGIGNNL